MLIGPNGLSLRECYRTATVVRSCEKIGKHAGLADGSVCPTLTHKDLRLSGAGAFACEPMFSQLLREPVPFLVPATPAQQPVIFAGKRLAFVVASGPISLFCKTRPATTWRTHSCVQRSHFCERLECPHPGSEECEHGTHGCVAWVRRMGACANPVPAIFSRNSFAALANVNRRWRSHRPAP